MKKLFLVLFPVIFAWTFSGCGKKTNVSEGPPPSTPKEAATQLEQVFVSAPPEVKTTVTETTVALQTANYEKAIENLEAIKARQNLTLEQGMAIHNSMVALEAALVRRAAAGDPAAIRAYDQLRKSRRN